MDEKRYYEEREYHPYEDNSTTIYKIGINILLVILIVEVLFLIIGVVSTDFSNSTPQVVSLTIRKEKEYVNLTNEHLNETQQISLETENIYQNFINNRTNAVEKADRSITANGVSLKAMREELQYLDTPQRFNAFNERFLITLESLENANTALLYYFRSFEEVYLQKYVQYQQQYNQQMQQITAMWQTLLDRSSQSSGFNKN